FKAYESLQGIMRVRDARVDAKRSPPDYQTGRALKAPTQISSIAPECVRFVFEAWKGGLLLHSSSDCWNPGSRGAKIATANLGCTGTNLVRTKPHSEPQTHIALPLQVYQC